MKEVRIGRKGQSMLDMVFKYAMVFLIIIVMFAAWNALKPSKNLGVDSCRFRNGFACVGQAIVTDDCSLKFNVRSPYEITIYGQMSSVGFCDNAKLSSINGKPYADPEDSYIFPADTTLAFVVECPGFNPARKKVDLFFTYQKMGVDVKNTMEGEIILNYEGPELSC